MIDLTKCFQSLFKSFQSVTNAITNFSNAIPDVMVRVVNGEREILTYDLEHPRCTLLLGKAKAHPCDKPAQYFYIRENLLIPRCKKHKTRGVMNRKADYCRISLDELKVLQIMAD